MPLCPVACLQQVRWNRNPRIVIYFRCTHDCSCKIGIKFKFIVSLKNLLFPCKADNDFLRIAFLVFYLTLYLYFALCVFGSIVSMLGECSYRSFTINRFHRVSDTELLYSHSLHNKLLSAILIYLLVKRDILAFRFLVYF